jgi:uncharacterized protein (TIGR02444 family)
VTTPPGLWEWASSAYRRPGVEPLLLCLQDRHALRVNILLWCLWCGERYAELQPALIRRALDLTDDWTAKVTEPLRSVRRHLKSAPANLGLREQVEKTELAAERIELEMLEAFAADAHAPSGGVDLAGRARRNLAAYVKMTAAARTADFSISLLEELITLTFPSPDSGDVSN